MKKWFMNVLSVFLAVVMVIQLLPLNVFAQQMRTDTPVETVSTTQEEVDEAIRNNVKGWSFSRLSKVALAVLRIAVYELLFEDDIPDGVSANEAVELAKYYGGKEDASYVNGVISGVIRSKKNEGEKE